MAATPGTPKSSCACAIVVTNKYVADANNASFDIVNTGCSDVEVLALSLDIAGGQIFTPAPPVVIPEDGFVSFTLVTEITMSSHNLTITNDCTGVQYDNLLS